MTIKIKRKAIPMTPEVMRKFKEHNEKLARESKLRGYLDQINAILDVHGEVKVFRIDSMDIELIPEISKRLINAGWLTETREESLSVWLD